jgi:hypothetical protein
MLTYLNCGYSVKIGILIKAERPLSAGALLLYLLSNVYYLASGTPYLTSTLNSLVALTLPAG